MRQTLLAGLAIALTLVGGPLPLRAAAPRPVITKVFGPETRTGPYKHPASLTELFARPTCAAISASPIGWSCLRSAARISRARPITFE